MRDSEDEKLRDLLQWIDSLRKRSLWKVRKNHYYQFVESSAPHFSKLPLKINFILLFYFSIDKSQQLPMVEMGAKILVRNYNNYSQDNYIGDKFFLFFRYSRHILLIFLTFVLNLLLLIALVVSRRPPSRYSCKMGYHACKFTCILCTPILHTVIPLGFLA